MKTIALTAACLALAACGSKEPAAPPTDAATDMAATATPAAPAAATDMTGTYEVKMADGKVVTETINADGTYVDMMEGKESERGKWRADGAKTCFDPDGAEPEMCYTTSAPGADGSFKTIGPDGKETGVTVRKTGAAMAATPAT